MDTKILRVSLEHLNGLSQEDSSSLKHFLNVNATWLLASIKLIGSVDASALPPPFRDYREK